jgi:hypothetical protein
MADCVPCSRNGGIFGGVEAGDEDEEERDSNEGVRRIPFLSSSSSSSSSTALSIPLALRPSVFLRERHKIHTV